MRAHSWLAVLPGADHGMACKPARTTEERRKATGALAARWIAARDRGRTECVLAGTEIEEWKAAKGGADGEKGGKRLRKETVEDKTSTKAKKARKAR